MAAITSAAVGAVGLGMSAYQAIDGASAHQQTRPFIPARFAQTGRTAPPAAGILTPHRFRPVCSPYRKIEYPHQVGNLYNE